MGEGVIIEGSLCKREVAWGAVYKEKVTGTTDCFPYPIFLPASVGESEGCSGLIWDLNIFRGQI